MCGLQRRRLVRTQHQLCMRALGMSLWRQTVRPLPRLPVGTGDVAVKPGRGASAAVHASTGAVAVEPRHGASAGVRADGVSTGITTHSAASPQAQAFGKQTSPVKTPFHLDCIRAPAKARSLATMALPVASTPKPSQAQVGLGFGLILHVLHDALLAVHKCEGKRSTRHSIGCM